MARISRTGTTDSTGVASTTVTGTGGGRLKFISRNGGLWSNSKEILDAIFVDSSDCTVHPYNNNTTAEWIDNYWKVTMQGVTGTYFDIIHTDRGVYGHYVPLNTVKGQTVTVEFDFKTTSNQVRSIAYYDDGTGWRQLESAIDLEDTNDEWVHFKRSYTFSSEATRVWVRLQNKSSSVAVTFSIKDLVVYPTFTAPKHYTPIALSSSASIIQTGESATLSAELTNVLDEKLANKSVNFIEKFEPTNLYVNDGTDTSTLTIPSGVSVTVENGALKITTSTTGEKTIAYNYDLNNSDNFLFECEVAKLGTSQSIAMYVKNSTTATGCWFNYGNSTNKWEGGILGSTFSNVDTGTLAVGDKIKIKQLNGVITLYHNDAVIYSKTANLGSNFKIGHYTNNGRVQYIKNIKITDWAEDTLIGTGTTNSQGIATCSNSITGTGKGERQITAKVDNVESETYSIWDTLFYDSDTATWQKSNVVTSFSNNTRNLELTARSSGVYAQRDSSWFIPCSNDFIVEFDWVSDGNASIYIPINGQTVNMGIATNSSTWSGKHIKLYVKPSSNETDLYIDGVYQSTITNTRDFGTSEYCGFRITNNTNSTINIELSNLKIYSA